MKKLTKVAFVVVVVMVTISMLCLASASALGFSWDDFKNMLQKGSFSFDSEDLEILETERGYREMEEDFTQLDIEFGSGFLEILYGDVEYVCVEDENVTDFECYVKNDTLYVKGNLKAGIKNHDGTICITIPNGMTFREVEIEVGAGKAKTDGIVADKFSVEVGAGSAEVARLDARQVQAETGAGELIIEVVGKKEDYGYNLECGIGTIQLGEESYSGMGAKTIENSETKKFLDVECGIGELQIRFLED